MTSGPIAEAVIELRADVNRLREDAKREGKRQGKAYGDEFDKGTKSGLLSAGTRLSGILTIAGAAGPALLAVGSAMSAAAAGGTALIGALGPAAAGGLAAFAGGLLAVEQGTLALKFGLAGMDKAIKGDAKAMGALAPAARSVATELRGMKPEVESVRRSFTGSLFAGVGSQIQKLGRNYFPLLRTAARQTGSELNGVALRAAKLANTGPFRRDFSSIASTNAKNLGNLGQAGVSLADAARSLIVTSAPLQRMFFGWATGAAAALDASVQAGRQSGKLQAFFAGAARSGAQLGHILADVSVGIFNIFRIGAAASGGSLLSNVQQIAKGFRAWTESGPGIQRITQYFRDGAVNLAAMGKLLGAVTGGLASIGTGKQLAPLIDQIRTQLLPPLVEFLHNASASGALSSLITAVATLTQVFADLAANDGSLVAFARTLNLVAKAAQFIVEKVPGASQALGALLTVLGGYTALRLVGLGGAVRGLAGNLFTLGEAASGQQRTFRGLVGDLRNAETRTAALGTVMGNLRSLVGVVGVAGGLQLIGDSSNRASKGMSALQSAAGGALTGAGLGMFAGPEGAAIGAAIGGLAGGIYGLVRSNNAASGSGKGLAAIYRNLAATLDATTGATTRYTKAQVLTDLTKRKLLTTTRELGFSDRQAVAAITSQGTARNVLTGRVLAGINATQKEAAALNSSANAHRAEIDVTFAKTLKGKKAEVAAREAALRALLAEMGGVDKSVHDKQREIAVTRTFSKAINSLPREVRADIKTHGLENTRAAVVDLTRKYGLARKDVATLIRENGGTPTKRMIDSIIRSAQALNHQRPVVHARADTSQASSAITQFIRNQSGRTIILNVRAGTFHAPGGPTGSAVGGTQGAGRLGWVGERGRELVELPAGARVVGNSASEARVASGQVGGGGGPTINVQLPTGDPEAAGLAVFNRLVLAAV